MSSTLQYILGLGPAQFNAYFVKQTLVTHPEGRHYLRRHKKQLQTYRVGKILDVVKHSMLGLIDIYNLLPQETVDQPTMKDVQHSLQALLCGVMLRGMDVSQNLLSPRNGRWCNKLNDLRLACAGDESVETMQWGDGTTTGAGDATVCILGWLRFKDHMSKD